MACKKGTDKSNYSVAKMKITFLFSALKDSYTMVILKFQYVKRSERDRSEKEAYLSDSKLFNRSSPTDGILCPGSQ